jgi:signal recognition particle receptor subunit beta
MQTNVSTVVLPDTKVCFKAVDIPGHPRIRGQFVEHLSDAKVVAFVVDTNTISRNAPVVAE